MIQVNNRVYISVNEKKGIIAVSFKNPITGGKTTKSLGKDIGIDEEKANIIAKEIESIINQSEYYLDYTGYLKAKSKFNPIAIRCVYEKTDLLQKFNEEYRNNTIERLIPIKSEDGKTFREHSIQFIGTPGSGKTKTIQQLLGSIKYNVPASTTSNTTFGSFEAYICDESNEEGKKVWQLAALLSSKDEINYCITENIKKVMILFLINMKNNTIGDYQNEYDCLFSSSDMKLRLYMITGRRVTNIYEKVLKEIEKNVYELWNEYCIKQGLDFINYVDVDYENKENFKKSLEEEKAIVDFIEEKANELLVHIENDIFKVLTELVNIITRFDLEGVKCEIDLVSDIKQYGFNNKDKAINKLIFNENEWFKYIYIKITNDFNIEDVIVKELFFKLLRFISCADEAIDKNLFPMVSNLRIKGDFRPLWDKDNYFKSNYILIDSEGVGHDLDNISFNTNVEENMLYADKIMWIINSTKDFSFQDRFILENISINGCLNKTTLCFNRLEDMDKNSEGTEESKERRITLLLDNLFKSFEKNSSNNSIDFTIFKSDLKNRKLVFEYLDRVIDDNIIYPKDICDILDKVQDKEIRKNILMNANKIELNKTISSFKEIININDKKICENGEKLKLIYSWIKLSNYCDDAVKKYSINFKSVILQEHWSTVKAFNSRMAYDWQNREWRSIRPELELKIMIKRKLIEILMNPKNINNDEKEKIIELVQVIQEDISKKLSNEIKKIIYEKNKSQWLDCYNLNGNGSGNERKCRINKIINDTFEFDRNNNEENIVFEEVMKIIKELNHYKDGNIKFIL